MAELTKRLLDLAGAGLLLLLLAPVLALAAGAAWVGGLRPVLFRQLRTGYKERPFWIWKLRTMTQGRDAAGQILPDNQRLTPLGQWLRRHSLDELPQLWNVLTGRMSLVGPRPPLPSEVAQYLNDTHRRLAVKPGLTGLWQVSGRSDLSWEESVRLDLRYVENWSLTSDLLILARTVQAVVRSSGAY